MNATYSIDHLKAITHVANVLNATNLKVGEAPVYKPKVATTAHYDPEGKDVGSVSTTSYEGLTLGANGRITGGSLSHESTSPEGAKLTSTSIGFQSNGKPAAADISIHNVHTDGEFSKVSMDMSGATWNDSFGISSGQVKVSTTNAETRAKSHEGTIQFEKDALVGGSFTHYSADKPGEITGYSQLDYSKAKFLGTSIVGGQYSVTHHNADKSLSSNSLVTVSPLGRLQTIETTNLGADASVKTRVTVDFSNMVFNARNQLHSGNLKYTAVNDKGVKLSDTVLTYQNAAPSLSQTTAYRNNSVLSKIVVDYAQSIFNNNNQVVSSTKKVDLYSGDNKLISSNIIGYDKAGARLQPGSTVAPPAPKTLTPPAIPKFSPLPPQQGTTEKRESKTRSDNTLQALHVTTMVNGKPVSEIITMYGPDGTTVIKTFTLDLTKINFDENSKALSGSLNLATHLGGTTLHAASSVEF